MIGSGLISAPHFQPRFPSADLIAASSSSEKQRQGLGMGINPGNVVRALTILQAAPVMGRGVLVRRRAYRNAKGGKDK